MLLLYLLLLGLIFSALYWLIVTTEGVYLGRRVVIWLYDLFAQQYEHIKGYVPEIESRFLGRPIMQLLGSNTAPLILDVATGTGRLPRTLLAQPAFQGTVIGIDLSQRMLHYGAARLTEAMYYGRVHLMHIPAENLPFPDATFDLVSCLEALEFMHQPRVVVAELVRVTRPGGWLLLTNRCGTDAKLMPGKAWTPKQARRIYTKEFGLMGVRIQPWQFDYDLVWAQKPGSSSPTRKRPLEEIWRCSRCAEIEMIAVEGGYICGNCEQRVSTEKDGVILAIP